MIELPRASFTKSPRSLVYLDFGYTRVVHTTLILLFLHPRLNVAKSHYGGPSQNRSYCECWLVECVRTAERIILHVFIAAKDTEKGVKSVFLFANY